MSSTFSIVNDIDQLRSQLVEIYCRPLTRETIIQGKHISDTIIINSNFIKLCNRIDDYISLDRYKLYVMASTVDDAATAYRDYETLKPEEFITKYSHIYTYMRDALNMFKSITTITVSGDTVKLEYNSAFIARIRFDPGDETEMGRIEPFIVSNKSMTTFFSLLKYEIKLSDFDKEQLNP